MVRSRVSGVLLFSAQGFGFDNSSSRAMGSSKTVEKELVELFEKVQKAADKAITVEAEEERCLDALKALGAVPVTMSVLVSSQYGPSRDWGDGCYQHPQGTFVKDNTWRASKGLQLVHNDVAGLIPTLSFQRARSLLTFIDDNYKQTWIYLLKNKSEAFDTFLEAIWKTVSNVCRDIMALNMSTSNLKTILH